MSASGNYAATFVPELPYPNSTTPHWPSSYDSDSEECCSLHVREIRDAVNFELIDAWVAEEEDSLPFQKHLKTMAEREYPPNLDERVQTWLDEYGGYDSQTGQWDDIPAGAKEDIIYDPIVRAMDAILKDFGLKTEEKDGAVIKRRKVLGMHSNRDGNAGPLECSPDISVFGTGPSATKETDFLATPSYSQVASVWEVETRPDFSDQERGQVGSYAREVFIQQPNRRFVYVTLMTSIIIRILRFDRAGCYYTWLIHYHQDPVFFVKLVLLLSSLNEELLGFDTSISWIAGQRVMKMTPRELFNQTKQRWEPNTSELVFTLADQPMFFRRTIRSRGTVCWIAEHAGQQYIIKDYWRADDCTRESAFLKELTGVKGVGQMFAFDDDRDSIKTGRGFGEEETMISDGQPKRLLNKWFMRLVLPKYGDTLERARSASHLLCAVRDIVKGHRDSLMLKRILHRDISFANLLLSSCDTYGVLIDWDLAKHIEELITGQGTDGDSRTGTRAYQSVKVLHGSSKLGHHDNMDDIESIFYVLYHVLFGHDTSGNPLPYEAPGQIADWHNIGVPPVALAKQKKSFLRGPGELELMRYTGQERSVLYALMSELQKFFYSRMNHIGEALAFQEPVAFPEYSQHDADEQYERFLAIVDGAIQKLLEVPPTPAPPSPNGSSVGSSKRCRTDNESEMPGMSREAESKRRRAAAEGQT
ncbi:hypothetical protein B0H17DRAFT_596366 [Mycena rosella]|uniref:Protein kinase domain-containing protein n=1 Tax=Mycena rosella TaxID=1033263 RepID=A0AAD7DI69_MYCRO|nr:hypothetical protein B0H17DRAFT_596366 [Mycena rosella]